MAINLHPELDAVLSTKGIMVVASDFDQTLSKWVSDGDRSILAPGAGSGIASIAGNTRDYFAEISSREVENLRQRTLDGTPDLRNLTNLWFIGTKGLQRLVGGGVIEVADEARPYQPAMDRFCNEAIDRLRALKLPEGIELEYETKGSLAFTGHVRNRNAEGVESPELKVGWDAMDGILRPMAEKNGFNWNRATQCSEVTLPVAVGKGHSLKWVINRVQEIAGQKVTGVIVLGDERHSDGPMFEEAGQMAEHGIKVVCIAVLNHRVQGNTLHLHPNTTMVLGGPEDMGRLLPRIAIQRQMYLIRQMTLAPTEPNVGGSPPPVVGL
jgi:trehalose-phosphatase